MKPKNDRELLYMISLVLKPLDAKIDHSLHIGTVEQMRADLSYLRGLLDETRAEIEEMIFCWRCKQRPAPYKVGPGLCGVCAEDLQESIEVASGQRVAPRPLPESQFGKLRTG